MNSVLGDIASDPMGKMYLKLIEKRLLPITELQLSEEQIGFKRNQGTNAIFTLIQLSEHNMECNINMYMAFIDQEKELHRINGNLLESWKVFCRILEYYCEELKKRF